MTYCKNEIVPIKAKCVLQVHIKYVTWFKWYKIKKKNATHYWVTMRWWEKVTMSIFNSAHNFHGVNFEFIEMKISFVCRRISIFLNRVAHMNMLNHVEDYD